MKIYTKTGDNGKTSLLGKANVYKSDLNVEAYGTIDELNVIIGICIGKINNAVIKKDLIQIQNNLFLIGSYLADVNNQFIKTSDIKNLKLQTKILEGRIDKMELRLTKLTNFILPGGSEESTFIHLARVVTRRAERYIVKVHKKQKVDAEILMYINRLSDYFFELSRYLNFKKGYKENIWKISA